MRLLLLLFWADWHAGQHWIRTQTASKIFVMVGMFFLTMLVAAGIYGFSAIYFRLLASYSEFGTLTATYIIHAAIIIVLWFGILSSIMSTSSWVRYSGRSISYLQSLPIPQDKIPLWIFLKTAGMNLLLAGCIFLPIAVAYQQFYPKTGFYLYFIVVLLAIVLLAVCAGQLISYLLNTVLTKHHGLVGIAGLVIFLFGTLFLLRSIFPPIMMRLIEASPSEFTKIFSTLPLSSPYLPTSWLVSTLTEGFSSDTLLMYLFTLPIILISLKYQQTHFHILIDRLATQTPQREKPSQEFFVSKKFGKLHPLLLKDLLSVFRSPSEIGYAVFLLAIMIFFFAFLSQVSGMGHLRQNWQWQITVFTFGWILFFATAYLLRLVFPLMAREGMKTAYLFSLPLPRTSILREKVKSGLLLSLPILLISSGLWIILPYPDRSIPLYLSGMAILLLTVMHTFLGAIRPNFHYGHNPEQVSTSGMGILALLFSVLLTIGMGYIYYLWQQNAPGLGMTTVGFFLATVFLLLNMRLLATRSVNSYEF